LDSSFQIPDLASQFPAPQAEDWPRAAEEILKGGDFDKVLKTLTYEGILTGPIYPLSDPHTAPAIPAMRPRPAWFVTQPLFGQTVAELSSEWQQNALNGQTGLRLPEVLFSQKDWPGFFNSNTFDNHLVCLPGGLAPDLQLKILNLPELRQSRIWLQNETSDPQVITVLSVDTLNPAVLLWAIDTISWQETGANAVQELAIALSATVQLVRQLSSQGFEPEKTLPRLGWQMAIGANFFTEIARFRAARVLYALLAEAWQVSAENMPLFLAAQTSRSNKSRYDRHVNILRATGETFAAALSGVDKDEIAKIAAQRRINTATLRDKYIGINAFPLAGERPDAATLDSCFSPFREFEELRDCMNAFVKTSGRAPKACLLTFGAISGYKPRADFSQAFLDMGGFGSEATGPFPEIAGAVQAAAESRAEIIVLCAADEIYPEIVADFCQQFRTGNTSALLVLAGSPGANEAEFRAAGIDLFIHRKVNVVNVLGELQVRLGVQS